MKNKYYNSLPPFAEAIKRGYCPDYVRAWSNEHYSAVENMYNHAVFGSGLEPRKVTVEGAPPGTGKSSMLQAVATMAERKQMTALMMTDSNNRLRDDIQPAIKRQGEWLDYSTDVAYLSRNDRKVTVGDMKSMSLANLVAMSCQRYLLVNDEIRKNAQTHWWRGQTSYRDVFCVDEKFEDVTQKHWYYSDLTRFLGILRETIRPEKEWENNIGETAKKAEKYARILVDDLLTEVDRINKIQLPETRKGLPSGGQLHIDFYTGCENRREEADKKWRELWPTLLELVQSIKDGIKETKKDLRSIEENQIFAECNKILKTMSGKIENSRNDTIISALEKIENLAERLTPGRFRSELKDMATEARRNAERAFASEELAKIVKNNRENMLQNNEHVRGQAMTSDEFLDIFGEKNVVVIQASNHGDDKRDKKGQVQVWCYRYNIEKLPYKKMRTIIYDGTSHIDPMYDNGDIFQKISYEKPKTHVRFIHLDEKSSKTHLENTENAEKLCDYVAREIWDLYGNKVSMSTNQPFLNIDLNKIMISTFKQCSDVAAKAGLAIPEEYSGKDPLPVPISRLPLATFGSALTTGSNLYKDCYLLCKIGTVLQSQADIFMRLCCRKKEFCEEILNLDEVRRTKQLQLIWTNNCRESDYNDEIEDSLVRTAVAAIVQEINRTRIRGWCDSADPVERSKYDVTVLWATRSRKQGEYDLATEEIYEKILRIVMEEFGSNPKNPADYKYVPSVLTPRLKPTEKPGTLMAKAREVYEGYPEGKEFTAAEFAADIGVNRNQLNSALKKLQNQEFLELIRGKNDENIKKVGSKGGYVYLKPMKKVEKYEQQELDLKSM